MDVGLPLRNQSIGQDQRIDLVRIGIGKQGGNNNVTYGLPQ